MKRINDFFGPSAEKRRVDGKYIVYLRIMIIVDVQHLRESYFTAALQGSQAFSPHNKQA